MHTNDLTIQLIESVKMGRHDQLLFLVEAAKKDDLYPVNLNEPLSWAAHNGQTNAALLLLNSGANINYQDSQGNTPLHWAAYNAHAEMVTLLIKCGANERVLNNNHLTPAKFAQVLSNGSQQNYIPKLIREMSYEIKQLRARVTELENALVGCSSPKQRYLSSQFLASTDAQAINRFGTMKSHEARSDGYLCFKEKVSKETADFPRLYSPTS